MRDSVGEDNDCLQKVLTGSLLESLSIVEDPRAACGKRYLLPEVPAIIIFGCMCGCDNAEALEDWVLKEREWLSEFLPLKHGTPSQDVFLRWLASINVEKFRQSFLNWVQSVFEPLGLGVQVAIDGQTHRGSGSRAAQKSPLHVVSAVACESSLVIGQVSTSEKSNKIRAILALIEMLDLERALISIDAMGTQPRIVQLIQRKGADYLLAIKKNQKTLHWQTLSLFEAISDGPSIRVDEADPPEAKSYQQEDGGHGRMQTRTTRVVHDFKAWVPATRDWRQVKTLIDIHASREDEISGATTTEDRYTFSSRKLSAEQAHEAIGPIENQLHWVTDVSFNQDNYNWRTQNAAKNMGLVRQFSLNLIRSYTGDNYSVPRRRRRSDDDRDYREQLLAQTAGPWLCDRPVKKI